MYIQKMYLQRCKKVHRLEGFNLEKKIWSNSPDLPLEKGKKVKKQSSSVSFFQTELEELQLATCVFAIEPKININQGVYGGKKTQKLWNDIFPLEIAIPNVFNKKNIFPPDFSSLIWHLIENFFRFAPLGAFHSSWRKSHPHPVRERFDYSSVRVAIEEIHSYAKIPSKNFCGGSTCPKLLFNGYFHSLFNHPSLIILR